MLSKKTTMRYFFNLLILLNLVQGIVAYLVVIYAHWIGYYPPKGKISPSPPPVDYGWARYFGYVPSDNGITARDSWFSYVVLSMALYWWLASCAGHYFSWRRDHFGLGFYSLLITPLIVVEAAIAAFIAFDDQWEKDIWPDPTGAIENLQSFVKANFVICKWFTIGIVFIQVFSVLLAIVLWSALKPHTENECGGRVEPLLHPLPGNRSKHIKGNGIVWGSWMRKKGDRARQMSIGKLPLFHPLVLL